MEYDMDIQEFSCFLMEYDMDIEEFSCFYWNMIWI